MRPKRAAGGRVHFRNLVYNKPSHKRVDRMKEPDITMPRSGEDIWLDIYELWKSIDKAQKAKDPNFDVSAHERSLIDRIAAEATVWEAWHPSRK
jgi:hypothetical protein